MREQALMNEVQVDASTGLRERVATTFSGLGALAGSIVLCAAGILLVVRGGRAPSAALVVVGIVLFLLRPR
jgi:hypothetical protein